MLQIPVYYINHFVTHNIQDYPIKSQISTIYSNNLSEDKEYGFDVAHLHYHPNNRAEFAQPDSSQICFNPKSYFCNTLYAV